MNWSTIFSMGTLMNTINTSTIVILAALGCLMTDQAGMMNIGIDGMMTVGAFAAVMGSWLCDSWVMGLVFALASGLLFGLFYGVFVIRFRSDEFIIGVALNIFAVALTTFILRSIPGQTGSFHPQTGRVVKLPSLHLGVLGGTNINVSIMIPIAWALVIIAWIFLYKTPEGFWLHASGEHPESLRSMGRSPEKMKYIASVICGLMCSLSGAYLSLGYLSTFTENMSASRGYVAVACVIFGRSNPPLVFLATLLFGFIDAAGQRMQGIVDPTLTATFPYIGTILMMVLLALRQAGRRRRAARA
ncbi:MAG: ABC transporter permease [Clostridia bacterium]|nr:ABC transporter permease [Clostridia bacterium]